MERKEGTYVSNFKMRESEKKKERKNRKKVVK